MCIGGRANTVIVFHGSLSSALMEWTSIGILSGLVIGKPLGITLFSVVAVALRWCQMPVGVHIKQLLGVGMLGGIGFTMSIFVTLLAFNDLEFITISKFAILTASTVAGILGYVYLTLVLPPVNHPVLFSEDNTNEMSTDQM